MLIDPQELGVVRDTAYTETKTFSNLWVNPDETKVLIELTLTIRALDTADEFVAIDQGKAMARAYVPQEGAVAQVILLGGRAIAMSSAMCESVANILVAQVAGERYDFEALCRYAVLLDDVWASVMVWQAEVTQKGKAKGKASSTESLTPSSQP